MQYYSDDGLKKLKEKYFELNEDNLEVIEEIISFGNNLNSKRAKELIQQGVGRRFRLLWRCVENIFTIFTPDRTDKLQSDELLDVAINLHAFMINIYGIIENLGLAIARENNLSDKNGEPLPRQKTNLFKPKFQNQLNRNLVAYLTKKEIKQWYENYLKEYRHALAHRIPLYVPPAALNDEEAHKFKYLTQEINRRMAENDPSWIEPFEEREKLGRSNPSFVHSFYEPNITPLLLHPQLIADFISIKDLLKTAIANFYCGFTNQE